jgi:hypothetical protein
MTVPSERSQPPGQVRAGSAHRLSAIAAFGMVALLFLGASLALMRVYAWGGPGVPSAPSPALAHASAEQLAPAHAPCAIRQGMGAYCPEAAEIAWLPLLGEVLNGYRIALQYPRSGEAFSFRVDPDVTVFAVPPHAAPPQAAAVSCGGRDDVRIEVVAETVRGDAPVWGLWLLDLCSGYPSRIPRDPVGFGITLAAEMPRELRATPLQVPTLAAAEACPVSPVREPLPGFWMLGTGSVGLAVDPDGVLQISGGANQDGWHGAKGLWVVTSDYQGPVRVRGQQLDGPHEVRFMARRSLEPMEMYIPDSGTAFSPWVPEGWRIAPSVVYFRAPGCYAVQFDGLGSTEILVLRAEAE